MPDQYAVKLLEKLVSFQSVSADPSRLDYVVGAAEFIKSEFEDMNFEVELVVSPQTKRPLLVAYYKNQKSDKTIGIYTHYDVQPEDPADRWESPPFMLNNRNGKFYGRGVADDKGHIAQAITAIRELKAKNKLKHSIIFVSEGEEEAGIAQFENLLKHVKICDMSQADVWFILDMGMKEKGHPQIFTGLRGIVSGEIEIETGVSDSHSGIFGNRIPNAAQKVVNIFAGIKEQVNGKVKVPGFYDDIMPVSAEEYLSLSENADTKDEIRNRAMTYSVLENQFVPDVYPSDMPVSLYSKLLPSFEINGIWSGYTGNGAKTIIPCRGSVKFSIRIVQGQKGDKMKEMITAYFAGIIPKWVRYKLALSYSEAVGTNTNNFWVKETAQVLSDHFGNTTVFNRSGGSIPAAEIISRLYNKPIIMTGFTLPDENIHAPNENIDEKMFFEGINVLKKLFSE